MAIKVKRATPRTDVHISYLVKQLERAIRTDMDAMAHHFGLTALQYTALSVLHRHPGMSGAQLARRSFVTAQAGSEMITLLERKGLISRTPDDNNRRILKVSLTDAGRQALEQCNAGTDAIEARMLVDLAPEEVDVLLRALGACIRSLKPDV